MDRKVGCCGTAGMSLKSFSEIFKLVEIQSTFYRLPRIGTAKKWRGTVPEDFEFTLKAFQGITHPKSSPTWRRSGVKLPDSDEVGNMVLSEFTKDSWNKTMEIASELESKYVVVQLPPSFEFSYSNLQRLETFFESVEARCTPLVEFRHASWISELRRIAPILNDLNVFIVTDPLKGILVDQRKNYLRLHGMNGFTNYKHKYSDEELMRLEQFTRGLGAYILFNNVFM
ncbi:DUF72 domain-containing protein, partial [Candidatus Bathyarchaeota archaeon]|nr:DUF72 domain-containing protein [Candidatus Bathyarchaeota archaeon]